MAEEFWSKEKLQKARTQVQREIDLNKRMLEHCGFGLSEKCIIVGELKDRKSTRLNSSHT